RQPLIIACQYGQTVTAGYLLSRGANRTSAGDNEGDTPLHWPRSKASADLMRMRCGVLRLQPAPEGRLRPDAADLASIAETLTLSGTCAGWTRFELKRGGQERQDAADAGSRRRHDQVERFLKAEIRSRASMLGARFPLESPDIRAPGNSKAPMLFLLFCILVWGYPTYVIKAVPLTFHLFPWLHWAFLLLNALMWFAFYHANTSDPGFLPRNVPEYDRAIQQAGVNSADIGLGRMGNQRLCHTCRCVKPVRAKHCRVCDRCVFAFAVLSVTLMTLGGMTMVLAAATLWLGGMDWIVLLGTVIAALVPRRNQHMTQTSMNKKRYTYLKDSNGNFRNPFDRGIVNNLLEFCHMRSPRYTAHELSGNQVSVAYDGVMLVVELDSISTVTNSSMNCLLRFMEFSLENLPYFYNLIRQ
uniref:Palmitoyltransferase n=1 Tax=Macrostomum lignano TaxID=282301 RepID=A0A1I8FGU7_9PLAT